MPVEEVSEEEAPVPVEDIVDEPKGRGRKRKVEDEEAKLAGESCAICLESEALLLEHGCPRCNKNSWKICENCNDMQLSRLCPVCQGAYSPRLLYALPDLPQLENPMPVRVFTDKMEEYVYSTTLHLISNDSFLFHNNCGVYVPVEKVMHFSLPRDISEDGSCDQIVIVSIPVDDESMNEGVYKFCDSTWESIENIAEESEEGAREVPRNFAKGFLMKQLFKKGAKLMTSMTPEQFSNAVKEVCEGILSNTFEGES